MLKPIYQQPIMQTSSNAKRRVIVNILIASTMMVGLSVASAQSTGQSTDTSPNAMSSGQSQMTGQSQMGNTQASPNAMMPPASGPAVSADPYIRKREADSMAKKEYKAEKKESKMQYKREKAEEKAALKAEKRNSTAERGAAIAADPSKPVTKGQPNYGGN